MPRASIVIVNLDGRKLLQGLLPGLFEQDTAGYETEVIVVDNGSTDGSAELVKKQFPRARVLGLDRNHGFAPAVNRGVKDSAGEYVVLLNNDCRVREGWLSELLRTFELSPSIACAGSLILDASGKAIDFQRGTANVFGWGFQQDRGANATKTQDEPFRAFFACGAACAFRRDIFIEAGGLLDETFAYFEDVEMGWRLNALGHEIWMNPASVVEHHHGATVKRFGKGFHVFLKERNALLNAWCNLAPGEAAVILPVALSLSALRYAVMTGSDLERMLGSGALESILTAGGESASTRAISRGMKDKLKKWGSLMSGSAEASVEAVADFGRLIPTLQPRRDSLQASRKRRTSELLELMGEPFRPVIGHPREKAFINALEPYLKEVIV
jgi:GT2 family glycosyltransferase